MKLTNGKYYDTQLYGKAQLVFQDAKYYLVVFEQFGSDMHHSAWLSASQFIAEWVNPKPKVKRAQYLLKCTSKLPVITPRLYENEVELREDYYDIVKVIKRLDHTEMEFDE